MAEVTAQTLPQQVVDDILSDLARGYRSTMMIASRHRVSVAVVDELRKAGGWGVAALVVPETADTAGPEPTVGGDAPVVEVPYGVAVEPDVVEPDQAPPTEAQSESGKWAGGLTAEERAECRAWCKANGVKVAEAGRIARPIVAQWRAATSSNATTDEVEEDSVVDAEVQDGDAPIPRCRCSHVQGWHHDEQGVCFMGACGCTQFRDADADPVAPPPDAVQPDATESSPDLRDLLRAAVTEVDARLDFAITHAPDAVEQLITACGEFVEWARTVEDAVRRVDAVESRLREAAETGELADGDLRSLAEALVKVVDAA